MATKATKTTKTTTTAKATKVTEAPPAAKAVETAPSAAPRPGKTPAAKAPAAPRVTFKLRRPGARAVAVAGTFNAWSSSAAPLLASPDGTWSIELTLAPGVYEYRFVVDGQWISDPAAAETSPNPFGGVNSVVRVSAY